MKAFTTPSGRTITADDLRPQTRDEKLAISANYYKVDFTVDTRYVEEGEK